jgi:hypothetical protein
MKAVLLAVSLLVGFVAPTYAEPETKKVCIDEKGKDGKPVLDKKGNPKQSCKTVKVHKKLEGTKVPEKK